MARRAVGRAVLAATGVGSAGLAYMYTTDEGFRRALRVYYEFMPVVAAYRLVEYQHKVYPPATEAQRERDWKRLDDMHAVRCVGVLGDLQGMYVKYGQTASGFNNTLGDAWTRELRKLEDKVPPRSASVVRRTIEEETGKSVEETFASFEEEPLGSASIGQVHKATLREDGRTVAVKVQYPEAQALFRKDMKTIRSFLRLVAPEQLFMLEEMETQNALEMDYRNEAENLERVGGSMRRRGFMPRQVAVPQPLRHLCTQRMLVMDLLPGVKLSDGLQRLAQDAAAKEGVTVEELEERLRRQIEAGETSDRYSGPNATVVWAYLLVRRAWNALLGRRSEPDINPPRVMDLLMRAHGAQLLQDGVFNADPHGGNFILMPDSRIGLIDYGSTKYFSRNERLGVCLVYSALYKRDENMLLDLVQVGGYKSKYGRADVVLKLMQFGCDSWGKEVTGGKNIFAFTDELKAADPWHEVPDNFVMAQLMSVRLRSLGLSMGFPVRCSDWFGPIALRQLELEGEPYESWDRAKLEAHKVNTRIQKHVF